MLYLSALRVVHVVWMLTFLVAVWGQPAAAQVSGQRLGVFDSSERVGVSAIPPPRRPRTRLF